MGNCTSPDRLVAVMGSLTVVFCNHKRSCCALWVRDKCLRRVRQVAVETFLFVMMSMVIINLRGLT